MIEEYENFQSPKNQWKHRLEALEKRQVNVYQMMDKLSNSIEQHLISKPQTKRDNSRVTTAIITGLLTLVIAMGIGWLTLGRNWDRVVYTALSEEQVVTLIKAHSPFNEQKRSLEKIENTLEKLNDNVADLRDRVSGIEASIPYLKQNVEERKR